MKKVQEPPNKACSGRFATGRVKNNRFVARAANAGRWVASR